MKPWMPYLKTLRRIPAPIIQAMATREIDPMDPGSCLCGWALRESMAIENGRSAEEYRWPDDFGGVCDKLTKRYGGDLLEWKRVFGGIADYTLYPTIETAFAIRVAECVR